MRTVYYDDGAGGEEVAELGGRADLDGLGHDCGEFEWRSSMARLSLLQGCVWGCTIQGEVIAPRFGV